MVRHTASNNASFCDAILMPNHANATNFDLSQNPFYIRPNENPSNSHVTPPLSQINYFSWSRAMRRNLDLKNKHDFLDGSILILDEFDPMHKAWKRCNSLVLTWIMNSVSLEIAKSLNLMETAAEVWLDLQNHFSQGDYIRISKLQKPLHRLEQGTLSVMDYYNEMQILWEELEHFCPLPNCTCTVQCSCVAMRNARLHRNEDHVILFLTGLNDNFEIVQSQILLMDPLPSLPRVFSMVLQQERQHGDTQPALVESQAFVNATDGRKQFGRGRGSSKICSFCGKIGHTVEVCYKKHGFPSSLKTKDSGSANCIISESSSTKSDETIASSATSASSVSFTQEQYNGLLALLQQSNLQASTPTTTHSVNQAFVVPSRVSLTSTENTSGFEILEDDWFG